MFLAVAKPVVAKDDDSEEDSDDDEEDEDETPKTPNSQVKFLKIQLVIYYLFHFTLFCFRSNLSHL